MDFFCRSLNLAVEVDGLSHDDPSVATKDAEREADLEALGITVLRFSSADVLNDLDNVVRSIDEYIGQHARDQNPQ